MTVAATRAEVTSRGANAHAASSLVKHHAPDRFTFVHQVEGVVDPVEWHGVGNQIVDIDLAVHVPVDDLRHVGAAARAAEGGALPDAAGDELERPRRDLLASAGHADDHRHAPTLVAAFERLAHGVHIADAFEAVIGTALGELYQMRDEVAAHLLRIDEMRHAERLGEGFAAGIEVDADDAVGADHASTLDDIEP